MNAQTKHTPGPWTLGSVLETCGNCGGAGHFNEIRTFESSRCLVCKGSGRQTGFIIMAVLDCVAAVHMPDSEELAEREANGRLIAAAPDLLNALKTMMPEGWGDDDTMDHMPGIKLARLAIEKAEGGR